MESISDDTLRQITGLNDVVDSESIEVSIGALEIDLMQVELEVTSLDEQSNLDQELIKETEAKIAAIRQAANDHIMALNASVLDAKEKAFDARKAKREIELKRDSINRQIDQLRRSKLSAQSFKMLETKWAEVFAQLTDAFPHQLNGARRMAQQRKLILADTMGLGKTRTALIACDLIQSMTNEASELNPITFEE